jgi:GTP-binding protein HflX
LKNSGIDEAMLDKKKSHSTAPEPETCILIGLVTGRESRDTVDEHLEELAFLASTAEATSLRTFIQGLDRPDTRTFVGSGKLQEIKDFVEEKDVDMLIFDDELSPTQLRNIEREIPDRKILDRPNLILDIFAQRARTAHAKTQVELAQYQYLLPRLTNMWTHLQKQKGGIGMKGPGEKEIETDRRIIRDRISHLKKELKSIDKQMSTQRGNRGALVRVALVGYTNAGKSTLMTLMSKSKVFAEDKLFATLDTTVRKVVLQNLPFLLSDTVGFIRKLPHQLIESFKSTLDETRESDLLLHVIDVCHPQFEEHLTIVESTLAEIGSDHKPAMLVFNKIDRMEEEPFGPTREDQIAGLRERFERVDRQVVFISAAQKIGMEELRSVVFEAVKEIHVKRYPYHNFLY